MSQTRIGILGASGRMGRAVFEAAQLNPTVTVGAAFDRVGHAQLGCDVGLLNGPEATGVLLKSDVAGSVSDFDVLIDFTRPDGTMAALPHCLAAGKGMVIGTTGMSDLQKAELQQAATTIPLCVAANFSVGVNVCLQLVEQTAAVLGEDFDIEIVEAHHRHKVDAPSGTALALGEAAAAGRRVPLAEAAVYSREGHTGARPGGVIGFATVRGGDVVGDHTVMYLGDGERIEITHKASSRLNFARGAVRAAAWLHGKAPGIYSMRDVLGL